jgi:hypothetical protein
MEFRDYQGRQLYLTTNTELTDPASWPQLDPLLPHFLLTLWWAENFLTKPNKKLGRAGPVCPFAGPSLERKTFWLTAHPAALPEQSELEEIVMGYRQWFLDIPSPSTEDAQYKTILILLPNIPSDHFASIIDKTQKALKPAFLREKLMIGQFHSLCEEPGVQNPAFRPLHSPVPMLVIRYMTSGDIVFMKNEDGQYNPDFLNTYLNTFGKGLPGTMVEQIQGLMTK